MSVQQQFAEQLEALAPRDVVLRVEQALVAREDLVVVGLQELGAEHLVAREQLLERGEGVRGDVEGGHLHVAEEVEEVLRVQHDLSQRLVPRTLAQHGPAVERDLLVLVARHQREQDLHLRDDVLHRGRPRPDLSPQHIVEHLRHVLLALEVDPIQVLGRELEKIKRSYILT